MSEATDRAPAFEPKSAVEVAAKVGLQAGVVGLVLSSIQNALGKHSHGAMGVLTRTGGTIGFFGASTSAMGGTFAFTETFVANQRQKYDAVNGAAGGCAAGFLAGVRSRSLPMALAGCALLGGAIGTFDYSGQLAGDMSATREERRLKFFKTPPKPLVEPASSD
ncbi:hypothetical protein BDZ97DRAFT_1237459 [Flammula alnicola]|nr:hypothetical protein BDZ97DRAFT_1237459 [Flammula alnicola]